MRSFLAGVCVGAIALAVVGWSIGRFERRGSPPRAASRSPAALAPHIEPRDRPPVTAMPEPTGARAAEAPFAPGEAWLAIGDGYVFGESMVRRDAPAEALDIRCLDIRGGVQLACPGGAGLALAPMSAVGLPAEPGKTAGLVRDAPARLDLTSMDLPPRSTPKLPGVGFVRARDGTVYKVHLAATKDHEDALLRRALVRYEQVPARQGGGEIDVPAADGARPVSVAAREALRRALDYRKTLRGASFFDFIEGDYETVTTLPAEVILDRERYLLVDGPLRTKVTIPHRGAVFATGGIDHDAQVVLSSYSGVGVMGDLAGTVDVKSYGYIYVDGDLTGTVNVDSYATVVIERDLLGTLKVGSYTDLLLRGRIRGRLEFESGNWSDFWFDGYWSRAELEALPGNLKAATLHVRSSDLTSGKHEGIGTWREVHVAEPAWEGLGR